MRQSFVGVLIVCALFAVMSTIATADDSQDEAIKKDRKLIEGVWRIVTLEVNGNKATEDNAKKLTVVNSFDGTWSLRSDGNEIDKGTSNIDPSKKSRTIDIKSTDGGGKDSVHLGIYELGENTRKLCFAAPGKARPTEFSSSAGSEHILVTFEREKDDRIKRDRQRIEGIWIVIALEVNGNKAMDEDARKLTVTIGADGSWSLNVEGREVAQGTSTIDPAKPHKAIDFTTTVGEDRGKQSLGIYEVSETTLKFCVAQPGIVRPGEFATMPDSGHIFLTLERGSAAEVTR